jgi:hypothetical protein
VTEKEFISKWTGMVDHGLLKKFPNEFLSDISCVEMKMPEANLVMGEELFGSFEILDSRGQCIMMADNYYRAKYILYSSRLKPETIQIPGNDEEITTVVKSYEKVIESLVKDIEKDFKKSVPDSPNFLRVSNDIFHQLNLKRY